MNCSTWNTSRIYLVLVFVAAVGLAAIPSLGRAPRGVQAVSVDTAGVHTDPVYAHANESVQWTSGGANFTISFQSSPWGSGSGTYHSSGNPPTVTSPPFPACSSESCDYKYSLEIGGKTFDPHVIIVP